MLTLRAIAAYYEVPLELFRFDIKSALIQSRENAGKNGKSRWHYFDSYMSDYIAFMHADNRASADFEDRAYGR